MEKEPSSLGRYLSYALATIFAVLFILTTPIVLGAWTAEQKLFDPQIYKKAFQKEGVFDRLPRLLAEQITYSASHDPCQEDPTNPQCSDETDSLSTFWKNINVNDLEAVLAKLLPSFWMQTEVESVIDQSVAYLSSTQEAHIYVSMEDIKRRLASETGVSLILQIMRSESNCIFDQLELLQQFINTGSVEQFPFCRPPENMVPLLAPQLRLMLRNLAQSIPDRLDLAPIIQGRQASQTGDASTSDAGVNTTPDFRWRLQDTRRLIHNSFFLPIGLILLIILFSARSIFSILRWLSVPLTISGFLMILLTLLGWMITNRSTASMEEKIVAEGFSPVLVQALADVAHNVIKNTALQIGLIGGGMALLGIFMLISSRTSKRPNYWG